MRTRKPGKRYGESPSTRNRLSGAFIEALAEQWREHGDEILDGLRKENPSKLAEIIAKLVAISEPPLDDTFDFKNATSMQDIGKKLLMSVGFENRTRLQFNGQSRPMIDSLSSSRQFAMPLKAKSNEVMIGMYIRWQCRGN